MGHLSSLLMEGVAIIERGPSLGSGSIGTYAINSDSSGTTFVDCLRSPERTPLTELVDHPLTRLLAVARDGAVALRDAGRFLSLVGRTLEGMIAAEPSCEVLTGHDALAIKRTSSGWRVMVRDAAGVQRTVWARSVVLATGAHQPIERLQAETVGGEPLADRCGSRLVQSGDVLGERGLAQIAARLAPHASPRVVVIGGSTSAAAVAHALLHRMPNVHFGPAGIVLMHRRELRIYYPDAASALAEGYDEFTDDDICPISGRVFRFAGFRLDSRELVMQVRGIGGRAPEPRMALHALQPTDPAALEILDNAHLVVAAMGYRPHAVPVLDQGGDTITLLAHTGPQQPLVDGQCRVLDAAAAPVGGLFGIGLAAGFMPCGSLGGEPSFRGQANGLWLWQNDVGALIVEAVMAPSLSSVFSDAEASEPNEAAVMPAPLYPAGPQPAVMAATAGGF